MVQWRRSCWTQALEKSAGDTVIQLYSHEGLTESQTSVEKFLANLNHPFTHLSRVGFEIRKELGDTHASYHCVERVMIV